MGEREREAQSTINFVLAGCSTICGVSNLAGLTERWIDVVHYLIHHRCAFVHNMLLFVGQDWDPVWRKCSCHRLCIHLASLFWLVTRVTFSWEICQAVRIDCFDDDDDESLDLSSLCSRQVFDLRNQEIRARCSVVWIWKFAARDAEETNHTHQLG